MDLDADGEGCEQAWESDETSPTVVPKLSLATGLVYAYTKTEDSDDPWYLAAIDFRSGDTVYKQLSGFGLGFNNNYAPITIGPNATAYVGVLGGLVALRDTAGGGEPPPRRPSRRGPSRRVTRRRESLLPTTAATPVGVTRRRAPLTRRRGRGLSEPRRPRPAAARACRSRACPWSRSRRSRSRSPAPGSCCEA